MRCHYWDLLSLAIFWKRHLNYWPIFHTQKNCILKQIDWSWSWENFNCPYLIQFTIKSIKS
jgi:hypothetical protein